MVFGCVPPEAGDPSAASAGGLDRQGGAPCRQGGAEAAAEEGAGYFSPIFFGDFQGDFSW